MTNIPGSAGSDQPAIASRAAARDSSARANRPPGHVGPAGPAGPGQPSGSAVAAASARGRADIAERFESALRARSSHPGPVMAATTGLPGRVVSAVTPAHLPIRKPDLNRLLTVVAPTSPARGLDIATTPASSAPSQAAPTALALVGSETAGLEPPAQAVAEPAPPGSSPAASLAGSVLPREPVAGLDGLTDGPVFGPIAELIPGGLAGPIGRGTDTVPAALAVPATSAAPATPAAPSAPTSGQAELVAPSRRADPIAVTARAGVDPASAVADRGPERSTFYATAGVVAGSGSSVPVSIGVTRTASAPTGPPVQPQTTSPGGESSASFADPDAAPAFWVATPPVAAGAAPSVNSPGPNPTGGVATAISHATFSDASITRPAPPDPTTIAAPGLPASSAFAGQAPRGGTGGDPPGGARLDQRAAEPGQPPELRWVPVSGDGAARATGASLGATSPDIVDRTLAIPGSTPATGSTVPVAGGPSGTAGSADATGSAGAAVGSGVPAPITPVAVRVVAAVPAPASLPQPVHQPVHHQVAVAVGPLLSRGDGSYSVHLQLTPEHLGRVAITLGLNGSDVSVALAAGDASARDLLRDNLDGLRQQLQQHGLKPTSVEVSSLPGDGNGPGPDRRSGPQPDGQAGNSGADRADQDGPTDPDRAPRHLQHDQHNDHPRRAGDVPGTLDLRL